MEKIKIVIIEDEFVIAEDVRSRLESHGYRVSAIFDRGENALPYILNEKPDLLLVDIHLAGGMNGIELVRQAQAKIQTPVVYITANSDSRTYDEAKVTHPNAFLIKPFSPENLIASIDLALYNFSNGSVVEKIERAPISIPSEDLLIHQCLFVRSNGKFKKVSCHEILFAEASGSYVHIQTTDQRYTLSQNLTQFQKKTPLPDFIRIHRSYIVNISRVDSFEESFVFIQNHKLPLSENHRAEFLSRIHLL